MVWTSLISDCVREELSDNSLSKYGKQIEERSCYGSTPLHFAVVSDKFSNIEVIIKQYPVLVNSKNYKGETPLHWACKDGPLSTVIYLLENGALFSVDEDGNTPFHWAIEFDRADIGRYFLEHNYCTAQTRNFKNESPVQIAVKNYSQDCLDLLKVRKRSVFTKLKNRIRPKSV